MPDKLIFLSHIHEEAALAQILKTAIEEEFGGFVEVFVSSDGTSIPAGANFLKRIEDGLIGCIGAIYLISPISVLRNWINFELGAVWIRNAISLRTRDLEIPTIPVCHSGILPNTLPAPLNNLNAIIGAQASQLEFAFRSIQTAVGGKGKLKSDFDILAANIVAFERRYTLGANLAKIMDILKAPKQARQALVSKCEQDIQLNSINLECGFVDNDSINRIRDLETGPLNGYVKLEMDNAGLTFGTNGAVTGADLRIIVNRSLIVDHKAQVLG